jgi:hypothetical protein
VHMRNEMFKEPLTSSEISSSLAPYIRGRE